MKPKFLILNLIVLALVVLANIFQFYFISYPMKFNFQLAVEDGNWMMLFIILSTLAVFSLVLGFLKIRHLDFQRIFLCFNVLILIFLIYYSADAFIKTKKEISKREKEYIIKAKQDIKNDNVTFEYNGGFGIILDNQKMLDKIDNIHKKYGVDYKNIGCVINSVDNEARQKYDETVKPYLEKRNGRNWESKMNAEIEKMRKENIEL
ncbi:FEKKY domain-containing protein [Epilithonimonas arachidiradicis]|uniref:Uncharacterized protein n=1 Tax=Epilithonimonas arachidiradicis TaxID=1617282 RepID=A0A420CN17_9FLAO|nr:hypothetical protein [Epilithonimonas arachidiradicis]RKE79795.1 hypothetical protein BXY58_3168 [Epilithonimonas arachidiradicis]GGG51690.1 hypothetical protein GCM10007332_11710 [Epilithonimonas arachidiradicis]